MSRPRVIDQNEILDAAEAVVARDGAARLTLDAVAVEAGISKASVIYDYKTKQALIKAVIERRVTEHREQLRLAIESFGPVPDAHIRGRIALAADSVSDDAQAVALNLCSALAQDAELRSLMQSSYQKEIAAILETSANPRSAILAFLALEGLRALEHFGLHSWPKRQRERILHDVGRLADLPWGDTFETSPNASDQTPPHNKH